MGPKAPKAPYGNAFAPLVESESARNNYPVQFDDRGRARFQYQLIDPGSCGPEGSCVLVVDDRDGQRQASAVLIFGAPAPPPPTVKVAPTELVEEGDRVRVDVTGLPPNAVVRVSYCDPRMHHLEPDRRGQLRPGQQHRGRGRLTV